MGASFLLRLFISSNEVCKKGKRKVQGVPQLQTAALPRPQEEEETKRGNRNTKKTEKHKNKMTHGKTYNKSPRKINHSTAYAL